MAQRILRLWLIAVCLFVPTVLKTQGLGQDFQAKPRYSNLSSDLSRLVERAVLASREESRALASLAPVSRTDQIAVSILISGSVDDALVVLAGIGVTPANIDADVIEAYVPLSRLAELADSQGILRIEPIRPPAQRAVTSEGVRIHNGSRLQRMGLTGLGTKVGIIDIGFLGLREVRAQEFHGNVIGRCYTGVGEFSGNLQVCEDTSTRHGTAMAEIVADMAPGVTLYIANPLSRLDLRRVMRWMTNHGVKVISHSVGWVYDGPGDGTSSRRDSPLRTIDMAVRSGALWVNAVGNEARSTWTGQVTDVDSDHKIEFSGRERNRVDVRRGENLVIQVRWDDVWGRAISDFDVYLENRSGRRLASSNDVQAGNPGNDPMEILTFRGSAGGYFVVVEHFAGPTPAWLQVQVFTSQRLSVFVRNRSLATPADSANPGFLAVGAANWRTPAKIEPFSSRGPTMDGRVKPDLVGIDGVRTAVMGRFRGTSQSAPHVAGLAALALQLRPRLSPEQLASLLISESRPRGKRSNNAWGHGLAFLTGGAALDRVTDHSGRYR